MSRPWTGAEIALVKRLYPAFPLDQVLAELPGRSWSAVTQMAYRLGLRNGKGRLAKQRAAREVDAA